MSSADKKYFEALAYAKNLGRQEIDIFADNKRRVELAKADLMPVLEVHGIDLILQAMICDIQEDIELRKKASINSAIAEKKLEYLSKALYCRIRNAGKPIEEDFDILGELDE